MCSIIYFPENKVGRDFVVGDIHGRFSLLEKLLDSVGFNRNADRLFCTGDLIDHGPESHRIVEFMSKPWFHSVTGNHERMLFDILHKSDQEYFELNVQNNGMGWLSEIDSLNDIVDIYCSVAALPCVIQVETRTGSVGILHAEVPIGLDWGDFKEKIRVGDKNTVSSCLWGRERHSLCCDDIVGGISNIFCGHTSSFHPLRLGNINYIDLGRMIGLVDINFDGRLSMTDITSLET